MIKIQKIPKFGEITWFDTWADSADVKDLEKYIPLEKQFLFPSLDIIHSNFEDIMRTLAFYAGKPGLITIAAILGGQIKALIILELITEEFYEKHKSVLCENRGLDLSQDFTEEQLKVIAEDFQRLIDSYLYNMGHKHRNSYT